MTLKVGRVLAGVGQLEWSSLANKTPWTIRPGLAAAQYIMLEKNPHFSGLRFPLL